MPEAPSAAVASSARKRLPIMLNANVSFSNHMGTTDFVALRNVHFGADP